MTELTGFGCAAALLLLSGVLWRRPLPALLGVAALAGVGFLAALWGQVADFVILVAIAGALELAALAKGLSDQPPPGEKIVPAFFGV